MMLLLSVALSTGAIFASFIVGRGIQTSMERSFARMGADLIVVPKEAMVNITSALLTVQPTEATFGNDLLEEIAHLDGVAQVAPQTIYHIPIMAAMPEHQANLIAFDPERDITVMPWINERMPRKLQKGDLLSGSRRPESIAEEIEPCNVPATVYGKLGRSGVGPLDESLFATYETVAALAQIKNGSLSPLSSFKPDKYSAVLVRLAFGATPEQVRFAIAKMVGIKVVSGPTIVTSTRQTISALLAGMAAFALLMLAGSLILVSLLFSAIIAERRREIGLLRAIGSRRGDILGMLVAEAVFTTGFGGICGIVFGGALLLMFQRSLVYYLQTLHVDFTWSTPEEMLVVAVVCAMVAAIFGLVGVVLPAWRASGAEPYVLIQSEGV
jgi:putative ABC transport system permease protein